MKKGIILCALVAGAITANAQTEIDNFNVGPYNVDYRGKDDVKYRLRDNIDLYDFFELAKDTTIVVMPKEETPVKHAIEIAGSLGAYRYAAKDLDLEGVWKQNVAKNLYLNGGLSFGFCFLDYNHKKRDMVEIGVPLQVEWGKLTHQSSSFYGLVGLAPTFYTTMKSEGEIAPAGVEIKKSGFLIAPLLEIGGNLPLGSVIMRIGVYGRYKVNCTPGDYDVYKQTSGRISVGAKIAVIL